MVESSNRLINLLQNIEIKDLSTRLYASVGYRALAMVSHFGTDIKSCFLKNAEQLARSMTDNNKLEKIVVKDNLYTCLQTMAKWFIQIGDTQQAEKYLREMITTDPYDSVGYSELGFFYANNERYDAATGCFKQAMDLGPPGTGMNTYYYAKCLEKAELNDKAATYFLKSAELDPQAISPLLDLMNHFLNKQNKDNAKEIAIRIHQTPILLEQLDENELSIIQNIIN